jgi:hypothetical protein
MGRSTQNRVRSGVVWRASAYGELEIPGNVPVPSATESTGLRDSEGIGVVTSFIAVIAGMESINACFVAHTRRSPYTLASKVITRSVYGG